MKIKLLVLLLCLMMIVLCSCQQTVEPTAETKKKITANIYFAGQSNIITVKKYLRMDDSLIIIEAVDGINYYVHPMNVLIIKE